MANLDQIRQLNVRYGKKGPISESTKGFSINERLDPKALEKALNESISNLGPQFTTYFDVGMDADVALLFIDVCSFSTRFGGLYGKDLEKYFDEYYDIVIPKIYKHSGEIDKIIGDGIICIFGPPFYNGTYTEAIKQADSCAKEIIIATKGTKFSSKIAFHCGSINYFKNKSGLYNEYTVIGKPLTELFRLETISYDDEINYYDETKVRELYSERISNFESGGVQKATWLHDEVRITNLKGVSYSKYFHVEYNP